ncbi:unnamed protein product [Litomosoides sigmodontis]|uniref:Trehalase n=1 Tax=Litomosoides sigmodontis TaxID=42156 RepID=A0A3P6U0M9_LITSI|nr:unnamed protein product [Litomosoides sigmodontis]
MVRRGFQLHSEKENAKGRHALMRHGTLPALLVVLTVRLLACLPQPSVLKLSEVITGIEKTKETNMNMCDETDKTGNWNIYCSGLIIAAMNLHEVETDSKTLVDRPLKDDPEVVLQEFKKEFGGIPIKDMNVRKLIDFRKRFFGEPGTELNSCFIPEWKELPPKIARIKDEGLKLFALFLNRKWKDLCRQIVKIENPKRNSLIEVPHPFIVPGGRFKEYYYWDAYWIVKGLIASDLFMMVKNILKNFIYCVKKFGFVPNGGRVYYLRRSHPPFLIPMVYEYYEATKDIAFIKENFDHLVKEYEFWVKNRSMKLKDKNGHEHTVYQYRAMSNIPRPELFLADIQVAAQVEKSKRRKLFQVKFVYVGASDGVQCINGVSIVALQDIASTAESGWDFSSRWFTDRRTVKTIETTNVLPVDLNALLCWNVKILKYFADIIDNKKKAEEFEREERNASKALNAIFYNDVEKAWFDYNLRTKSHNVLFYPTVAIPLFTGCYSALDYDKPAKVVDFINRSRVLDYPGGIPASVNNTGQNWDFPNGWPPLQHIIIEGLRKSGNSEAQRMAFILARKWIMANYKVYQATKKMWDKIDVVRTIPKPGVGAEYIVQDGFGWTNGVILDLLVTYYDRMTITDTDQNMSPGSIKPCRSKAPHIAHITIKFILLLHTTIFYLIAF